MDIKDDNKIFTESQKLLIKDIVQKTFPDEQKICPAFQIFTKDKNVDKLFEGFGRMDNLITELKEHKESHSKIEISMKENENKYATKEECHRGKVWKGILTFFGGIVGGYGGSHIPKV